jgi:hypothetical protein
MPIYALKMAHALISSEPTQVLKYFDIYASQDDLLVEHGSTNGNGNLASPLNLLCILLVILLDLLPSPVAR